MPQNCYTEYVNSPLDATIGQRHIHLAAAKGQAASLETWLQCGADIDILDDEGDSALHFAAGWGRVDCAAILLRYGCRRDIKDIKGKTPMDYAREKGFNEMITLLEGADAVPQSTISPNNPITLIWADAICINQNDVAEKSAQVTMMDRIYSSAVYVIAWLGPPDEHSDLGIKTLNTLHSHLKQFKESDIEPLSGKGKEKYEKAGVPYISWQEWTALASLYQRQWSRRAWIVQEAVLPAVLLTYIGDIPVTWRHLGQVAEAIRYSEAKLGTTMSKSFVPSREVGVSANSRDGLDRAAEYRRLFTLKQLLSDFWTFIASDPKDKVFAHYGLLNLFAAERCKTDYRLSLAQVYTMATRELIASEGNLQTLSECVFPLQRRSGLPSWVPDYGLPGANAIPANFCADKGMEYVPPKAVDDPACAVLQVRGAFIGKVSQVGGRPGTGTAEKWLFDRSWLTMALALRGKGGY
ncbi:ankyrin and HET domain-containing protein, partial [Cadophora sp. DSE1049]